MGMAEEIHERVRRNKLKGALRSNDIAKVSFSFRSMVAGIGALSKGEDPRKIFKKIRTFWEKSRMQSMLAEYLIL